jgi:hypothetical protein
VDQDPDLVRSVDPYPDPGVKKCPTKVGKIKINVLKFWMFSFEG